MTDQSPIHMLPDGSWWFYTVDRQGRFGPYATPQEAESKLSEYHAWLMRPKTEQDQPTLDTAVVEFIALRDEKEQLAARHKEELRKITEQMERLEGFLLDKLNGLGVTSVNTPHGTVYTQTRTMPGVADKGALYDWVRQTGNVEMLQGRVSADVLNNWLAANAGQLPPGVKVVTERKAYIRRS